MRPLIFAAMMTGDLARARHLLVEAQALPALPGAEVHRSTLVLLEGYLAEQTSDLARAQVELEEALTLAEQGQVPLVACMALNLLSRVWLVRGEAATAGALADQLVAIATALRSNRYQIIGYAARGRIAEWQGELIAAEDAYATALRLAADDSDAIDRVLGLAGLGRLALREGRPGRGIGFLRQSLRLAQVVHDHRLWGEARPTLSSALWTQGKRAEAVALARDWQTIGNQLGQIDTLERLATIAAEVGQLEHAWTWLGVAEVNRARLGTPLAPVDRPSASALHSSLRVVLGERRATSAWEAAKQLSLAVTLNDAVDWAIGLTTSRAVG